MPQIRVTYIFSGPQCGWTETWYNIAAANPTAVYNDAFALASLRSRMLCPPYSLVGFRASDDLIFRDARLTLANQPWNNPLLSQAAAPHDALTVRCESGTLFRRAVYMRGVPRSIFAANGTLSVTGQFLALFDAWRTAISGPNQPWALKRLDVSLPVFQIISALRDPADPLAWNMNTTVATNWEAGDVVIVRRGSRGNDLKGNWTVLGSGATNKLFSNRYRLGPFTAGMFGQKIGYLLSKIDRVTMLDLAHRDTGRPLFGHRGRQRASVAS